MAKVVADRVLETSTTTGTGAYTLAGAITGYISFGTAPTIVTGDTCDYYAEDVNASGGPIGGWETGLGTWSTGGILTRTTIYASSNAGAAVSWVAGTRRVGLGIVSASLEKMVSISDTAPIAPNNKNIWWDSTTGTPFVYYNDGTSSQWVSFVPSTQGAAGATGATGATGSDLASFRNKLIGGHFDRNPWQRGTTFTVTTSGTYVADRWRVDFDGTANITVAKVALALPQVINGVWCSTGLRFTVNSKSGNTFIRLSQRIEDVDSLTTLQTTLQTAIQGSASFTVPVNARQNFGTGGTPSADVVTPFTASLAVTSSMQQLNTGLVVPTIAGKSYGTGLNDFIAVEYDLMTVPVAGFVVIALSGLESGYVANVWEDRRRIELSLCQRYYFKNTADQIYTVFGSGMGVDATSAIIYSALPTAMRAIPTVNFSTLRLYSGTAAFAITSVLSSVASKNTGSVIVSAASGITAGQGYYLQANNSTSSYIDYLSEL